MVRKLVMFAALGVLASLVALLVPTAKACACVDPMPEAELNALKVRVDRGDINAISEVYSEYALARGDVRNAATWEKRAVRAGAPRAILNISDKYIQNVRYSHSPREKRVFAYAVLAILERGYMNRSIISNTDGDEISLFNYQIYYSERLREARAIADVMDSGIEFWVMRAQNSDPIAAYHVALYYLDVDLNQKKRIYWQNIASALGDPYFAGHTIDYSRTRARDLHDIAHAMKRRDIIARTGDQWMQKRFVDELRNRRASLLSEDK